MTIALKNLFNPEAKVEIIPLFDGHQCVIIDDFLSDPQALVDYAVAHENQFRYDADNYFPGLELNLGREFALTLEQYFMLHLRRVFSVRRNLGVACRLSMTTLQAEQLHPLQRLCHRDAEVLPDGMGIGAAVLYLFKDETLGGTSFYRPIPSLDTIRQLLSAAQVESNEALSEKIRCTPGYLNASNPYFELMHTVPAKWNRAIFYQGTVFHAAHITTPEHLTAKAHDARLTLNGFFKFKKTAK
jgi:hypothetical protein